MGRDVEMGDPTPVMSKDDEAAQQLKLRVRHDEEVDRGDVANVVLADKRRTASCCRRAGFSAAMAARFQSKARKKKTIPPTMLMLASQFGFCEASS
jgi:hypothetical protein